MNYQRPWLWPNRALTRYILTPILAKTEITPNQITFLSMASGALAGIFFSLGIYQAALWGVLFYEMAFLLDNADGEIARLKNMKSSLGAKLDRVCDTVTDTIFFVGVFLGALKAGIPGPLSTLLWISLFGLAMHYTMIYWKKKKGAGHAQQGQAGATGPEKISFFSELTNAASEGETSIVIVLLAIFGKIYWLVWLIPVYINALWLTNLIRNFKSLIQK